MASGAVVPVGVARGGRWGRDDGAAPAMLASGAGAVRRRRVQSRRRRGEKTEAFKPVPDWIGGEGEWGREWGEEVGCRCLGFGGE